MGLLIIATHPVQYHAPVFRYLHNTLNLDLTVIYGSNRGAVSYLDKEFGVKLSWDIDLLSGYRHYFLKNEHKDIEIKKGVVCEGGLERLMDLINPSAVLILGYSANIYQRAWLHAKKRKWPVFFRMETYDEPHHKLFHRGWVRDSVLRMIYKKTQAFCYIGDASKRHYQRLGVRDENLFFSPYAVENATFRRDEISRDELRKSQRRKLGIESFSRVILYSGKLIPKKNAEIILHALSFMSQEELGKIAVLYLGDGPRKADLQRIARRTPSLKVIFCGFQNQTQLSSFYHAADMLVLPSRYKETWGLVVNEALAHGLPCVVSNRVGCASDLIEKGVTGETFEAGDAGALTKAIKRVCAYAGEAETQKKCKEKVAPYSIASASFGVFQAYQKIL